MPPAPPLNDAESTPVQRPAAVDTSFMLWLVAAGISLIRSLLSFATQDDLAREIAARTGVTPAAAEPGFVGTIIGLVLLAAWVAVVFAMRSGHSWARIVLTVLGALAVLGGLFSLITVQYLFAIGALGVVQALCNMASVVVLIAAIVYMFKRESSHYFARTTA